MSDPKWIRTSLRNLRDRLQKQGHPTSVPTIRRLLRKAKFTLKANAKRDAGKDPPDRNTQFDYLKAQRTRFLKAGLPVIRIDTKKKELIGNYKNGGRVGCHQADRVNIHDFAEEGTIRAVPYGL